MANTSVFANSIPFVDMSATSKDVNKLVDPAGDASDPATIISSSSLVKPQQGSTTQGDGDQNLSPHTPLRSRRPSWEIPSTKLSPHRDKKRLSASCHTSFFPLSPMSLLRKSQHKSVSAGDEKQQKQRRNSQANVPTPNKQKSGFFSLDAPNSVGGELSGRKSNSKHQRRRISSLSPNGGRGTCRILVTKPPFAVPDLGTGELLFPTKTSSGDDGEEWAEPSEELGGSFAVLLPERPTPETLHQQEELVAAAALSSTSICPLLPKTKSQSQSFVIQVGGRGEKDLFMETPDGETMLTLDSNHHSSVRRRSSGSSEFSIPQGSGHHHDSRLKEKSYIRDAQGQLTAVIVKTVDDSKTHRYKVCSPHPAYPGQRRTSGINLYTWAEVKNANKSALGLQYSMRVKTGPSSLGAAVTSSTALNGSSAELGNNESSPPSSVKFVSEHFGPSLFKWDTPKGIIIRRESSSSSSSVHVPGLAHSGADSEQSAHMVYTRDARGLVVGPKVDPCLMFCFVTIIEEMIEKRRR